MNHATPLNYSAARPRWKLPAAELAAQQLTFGDFTAQKAETRSFPSFKTTPVINRSVKC